MSALDRLANYSYKQGLNTQVVDSGNPLIDLTTPQGQFLDKVHRSGYKLYNISYMNNVTNEFITEEQYAYLEPIQRGNYSKYFAKTELYDLLITQGNQCINAIAGAGKTSALVFKVMYDILSDEATRLERVPSGLPVKIVDKVWVCTFLRSGAQELKDSLIDWQVKMGYQTSGDQIVFSTLDAEFKRCLNHMGVMTNIGTPQQLQSLLKKAIDSCGITRDGAPLIAEDYNVISTIVTYYRGRITNDKYNHPSCKDYHIMPAMLRSLVAQFATLRHAAGIMDFDEIQELLYKYLYETPNKNVQDFVANRYNYIYLDEFQDTSQKQYEILKFYARGHLGFNTMDFIKPNEDEQILYTGQETKGKIVAIGDPSQCIYSFRGSDSRVLTELFDKDFRPTLSTLSVNWRCPANILNPIVPSIHRNKDSATQKITAAKEGGEFNAFRFPNFQKMVDYLRSEVAKDIENNMSVAILCRTNYDGVIPAFVLQSAKTYFDFGISSEAMTMKSALPRKILSISSLLLEKSTPAVKESLEMLVPRHSRYLLSKLTDTLKTNNCSIWDLPIEDIVYSCPDDLTNFVKSITVVMKPNGKRDRSRDVLVLKEIYKYYSVHVFNTNSVYNQSARSYIDTLLYLLEVGNYKNLLDFEDDLDSFNVKLQSRIGKLKAPIQIATVHESKGKEYDSVYVWNDCEGSYPSSKCNMNDEFEVGEERRIHYIACTRAKKKSSIFTIEGKVGMFVREMDVVLTNPTQAKMSL